MEMHEVVQMGMIPTLRCDVPAFSEYVYHPRKSCASLYLTMSPHLTVYRGNHWFKTDTC
jgi:surfactin synthase thioesterase subunit